MENKTIHLNGIKFTFRESTIEGVQKIGGYVCKWDEANANGWIITRTAFDESLEDFRSKGLRPRLDYEHDFTAIIGGIDSLEADDNGLRVEAHLNTDVALVRDTVLPLMKGGDLCYFSTEFFDPQGEPVDNGENFRVDKATLVGVGVVSIPADHNATAYLASLKPQRNEEKERVCADDNTIINQNQTEKKMKKRNINQEVKAIKTMVNGIEGADEAMKNDIITRIEEVTGLVADETSDVSPEEINNRLDEIKDLVESIAEKTTAEETAPEANAMKAAVVKNNYLGTKQAAHDFCNVIRNCQNRDSFRSMWNKNLETNGITVSVGSEEGYLPQIVHGYIQDAWDRNDNWLRSLRLTGAKRYAARINTSAQDTETSRAKGHTPGNTKVSQSLTMAAKIFDTQFVYKLMTMSKKTEYDNDEALLRYISDELYSQYLYELRRAILIGDGRQSNDPNKINSLEAVARATTDAYVTVGTYDNTKELVDQMVDGISTIKKDARGGLIAFMSETDYNALRRVVYSAGGTPEYRPKEYVTGMLGVEDIVTTDLLGANETYRAIVMRPQGYAMVGNPLDVSFVSWEDYKENEMNYRVEAPVGGGVEGALSAYVMKA